MNHRPVFCRLQPKRLHTGVLGTAAVSVCLFHPRCARSIPLSYVVKASSGSNASISAAALFLLFPVACLVLQDSNFAFPIASHRFVPIRENLMGR